MTQADLFSQLTPEDVREVIKSVAKEMLGSLQVIISHFLLINFGFPFNCLCVKIFSLIQRGLGVVVFKHMYL